MKDTNRYLKAVIIRGYGTSRQFLLALKDGKSGLEINENRLTRIITGRTPPSALEKRIFAQRLQEPIANLFPEE